MLRQFSTKRIAGFMVLDWLGSLALLAFAGSVRTRLGGLPGSWMALLDTLQIPTGSLARDAALTNGASAPLFLLVAILWPFFSVVLSVYDGRRNKTLRAELRNVAMAVTAATLTLAGVLFLTYRDTSRVLFLTFFILDLALLTGSRVVLWAHRRSRARRPSDRPAVLIVGAGRVGQNAARELSKYACADLELVGYLDDDLGKQGQVYECFPVLGTLDQAPQIVAEHKVRNAVVALPMQAHDELVEICQVLQQASVHVHVIPDLFALSFPNAELDGFGGIPVLDLGQPSIHGLRRGFKRVFDMLVTGLILLIAWPLYLAVAIAIKLDSPGPVFYKQQRIGENGRPFTIYKFRSMRANADTKIHQDYVTRLIQENLGVADVSDDCGGNGSHNGTLKLDTDPRITKVGHFIRKTSIDELPQLINVLRGEMSLVGPRPPIPYEVAVYQDWHRRRLEAIPGITGLWQVEGRNQVSFDEMVRLDLKYIQQQSFWLDVKILLQTPLSMVRGRGAG